MSRWEPLSQRTPDATDLEVLRDLAVELSSQHFFHDLAIDDPMAAESYVLRAGQLLQAAVGWPEGWRISVGSDEQENA